LSNQDVVERTAEFAVGNDSIGRRHLAADLQNYSYINVCCLDVTVSQTLWNEMQ